MRKLTSLVLFGSLAACAQKSNGTGVDTAASAVDSSESTEAEGNLMMAAVDGSDQVALTAPTADQIAAKIVANVGLRFGAGCAQVTQSGTTVTIVYNDCTGPRGLVHVTGTLTLLVSVSATGAISVHATSDDMQVNRATLVIDADATYAVSGTSHTLTVSTNGSGTGPRGTAIEHQGNYTITWDTTSQCGSIDGMWSTELGDLTRSNDVNVDRCAGGCPTGMVTHTFLRGQSITITFDGTATATWSASTGGHGTVALACGG
jgi:hypothetical protein